MPQDILEQLQAAIDDEPQGLLQEMFTGRFAPQKGGGMNVVVNNNTPAAPAGTRDDAGLANRKDMETSVDQMVAQALLNGRQTTGVMRNLFNLSPGLTGR